MVVPSYAYYYYEVCHKLAALFDALAAAEGAVADSVGGGSGNSPAAAAAAAPA